MAEFSIDLLPPLPLDAGSVLVIRNADFGVQQREVADAIMEFYAKAGVPAPLIMWLYGEQTLEMLDEQEMAAHGWVRRG